MRKLTPNNMFHLGKRWWKRFPRCKCGIYKWEKNSWYEFSEVISIFFSVILILLIAIVFRKQKIAETGQQKWYAPPKVDKWNNKTVTIWRSIFYGTTFKILFWNEIRSCHKVSGGKLFNRKYRPKSGNEWVEDCRMGNAISAFWNLRTKNHPKAPFLFKRNSMSVTPFKLRFLALLINSFRCFP